MEDDDMPTPALDLTILPIGKYGPSNQRLGIIWVLEFCRRYNLQPMEPTIKKHYTSSSASFSNALSFSGLFEVGRDPKMFKPIPVLEKQLSVDVIIVSKGDNNWESYMAQHAVHFQNSTLFRANSSASIFPFLANGVRNGSIKSGSLVSIMLFPPKIDGRWSIRRLYIQDSPWSIPGPLSIDEPYLPAHWLRRKAKAQLELLFATSDFIALHLRFFDVCFTSNYSGEFTLDACCCGVSTKKLQGPGRFSDRNLEEYIDKRMREFNASHLLILGHPIIDKIINNTSRIRSKADKNFTVAIWPTEKYEEIHPIVTTTLQQYMMTMAKQVYVTSPDSTIISAVQDWRAHYGKPEIIAIDDL